MTQWPRGVTGYVPSGPDDATPDPAEDRVRNRILLAGKLVGLLNSRGEETEPYLRELRAVEETFRRGDRVGAAARTERLLGALDARLQERPPRDTAGSP